MQLNNAFRDYTPYTFGDSMFDELRIWDHARGSGELSASMNHTLKGTEVEV